MSTYMLCGVMAGVGGLIYAGRPAPPEYRGDLAELVERARLLAEPPLGELAGRPVP